MIVQQCYIMMKVCISEKFGYLKEWIYDIARNDALPQGEVLRDRRNRIVRCVVGNDTFVVKRFGRPNPFNRIVYSFFRRTKAERSYRNTEKLRKMGYDSPEPVAYIELRSFGLFGTGYYICRWSPNPTIAEMSGRGNVAEQDEIMSGLAKFTARMHRDGIYFYDYNIGNIIYSRDGNGQWRFELIDVNRILFRHHALTIKESTDVLRRFYPEPELQFRFLQHYAEERGWNWQILTGSTLLKQGINLGSRIKHLLKPVFFRRQAR